LYGGKIYANLAYIYAQMGDNTKSKHYVNQYDEQFGDYGISEEDE
jgi:hypothetical protein